LEEHVASVFRAEQEAEKKPATKQVASTAEEKLQG
jgi:hypothetical protein